MKTYEQALLDETADEDMCAEHDFSNGVRGKYAARFAQYAKRLHAATEPSALNIVSRTEFQEQARRILSAYYAVDLAPGHVPRIQRRFDFISPDRKTVGAARYYAKSTSAHLATITEYVWLLEKVDASAKFLVFGNSIAVPLLWLNTYGNLLTDVVFYFLYNDDHLEYLAGPRTESVR